MKKILIGVAIALVVGLGLLFLDQLKRIQAAEIEAAALLVQRDAAMAQAEQAQVMVDSLVVADSIAEVVRAQEKEEAAARARALAARANELSAAIGDMLPPEVVDTQVRDRAMAAVAEIRVTYEERLEDQANVLAMTEVSLERSREAGLRKDEINANLRKAIALETERADLWEVAAQPLGFFRRIKSNTGLLSGALTLGVGIGAWIRGG